MLPQLLEQVGRFAGVYQSILDLRWASIKLNEHLNPLMD